jgi:hypothetical protein
MVCFQTEKNLGKFWRVLQWKMMVNFMTLGPFYGDLWTFGKVRGNLVFIFFPVLVFCTKKYLATLHSTVASGVIAFVRIPSRTKWPRGRVAR